MLVVAILALLTLAAVTGVFAQTVRSLLRSHARERGLLIDKIMHLSGKTWTSPPAAVEPREPFEELEERFVSTPAQLPDF